MASDSLPAEEYRAFADLIRFPLGETHVLVCCPLSRTARTIPAVSYRLLQGCRTFAPLDEHATRLCGELGLLLTQRDAVRAELAALAAAGLLTSRRALLERGTHSPPETPPRISTVGIPTRDRPRSLHTCLLGHLARAALHGSSVDLVVSDDSTRPETRAEVCGMLADLATRSPGSLWYCGPGERARYAEELAREAGLPPEDVRFALVNDEGCPVATGTCRNALLLHAVGEVSLQVDDDTGATLAAAPGSAPGLVLSSAGDPTEFWGFPEDAVLPDAGVDLLELHERLLGRRAADLLAAAGSAADLNAANAGLFRRLESGGRVLVTTAGVAGDSGMGSPLALLMLEGASRARLLATETDYRRAVFGRRVLRAVTRPTVGDAAFCMAMNLGLDHRDLLPPFLPVQRNQDGVFGAVLRACGGGFLGLLPWVLPHCPPEPRRADPETVWQRAARPHTGHLVQLLVGAFSASPGVRSFADRLRALGIALEELGSAPLGEFEEHVRLHVWNALSRPAGQLEAHLKHFGGQPGYWADDVRRALAGLREGLAGPEYARPWDLADAFGAERARELLPRLIRRYGRLLRAWPALVEAARRLRDRGVRPATPARADGSRET
jgi:hypothetical protein